jgi:hypothetical protein
MTEAYRCDITGECIPDGANKNPYWTILRRDHVTVFDTTEVQIKVKVEVDVFQDGRSCHVSDTAKNEINRLIKLYIQNQT